MTQEALKLAFEALKKCSDRFFPLDQHERDRDLDWGLVNTAVACCEKALAQPEQEPVALPCCGYADASAIKWNPHNQVVQCHNCGQIYTATPQRTWQGLTDEEIDSYFEDHGWSPSEYYYSVIKDIEAKLKEKNT